MRNPNLNLCLSLACACWVVFLVTSSVLMSTPISSTGGLAADNVVGQLGDVPQGSLATHEFTVVNRSDRAIQLLQVETSCSCTSVDFEPVTLVPHEDRLLPITFSVGENRGQTNTLASVFYRFEGDEEILSLRLRLVANVLPEIEVSHSSIRFERDEPCRKVVRLTSGLMDSFEVIRADCTHRCFSASLETVSENEVTIAVELEPSCWRGASKMANLVIATNSQAQPLIEIPLQPVW